MEEEQRIDEKQEEGIDANHKVEEVVEAQQGGIDGERKGSSIGYRKGSKMSESEFEQEVERLWRSFAAATGKVQTMKETPLPQDAKAAAAKDQLRAMARNKDFKSLPKIDKSDPVAVQADIFRRNWILMWTGRFGSYEDITRIPPMKYTDKKFEPSNFPTYPMETLQIFSIKIVETSKRFPWPLDVFGMVVARDALDHNRNIIFNRTRDNCQTISKQNPYLELIGPSRAVVVFDHVHLEVMLQVKRAGQAKDKCISFVVVPYGGPTGMESRVIKRVCPSKLSTVELTLGSIIRSVEATISVQVVGGSWPEGFRGEFTANTTSLDDMEIQLLAFGDGKLPIAADGVVKLSRRVVSVELKGELRVSVKAVGGQAAERRDSVFKAQRAGRRKAYVEVGSCNVKVNVAWSLLSHHQYPLSLGISGSNYSLRLEI